MGDMTPRIFTQHGKTYLHIPGLTAGPRASRRPSCRHSWENWWTDEDGTVHGRTWFDPSESKD